MFNYKSKKIFLLGYSGHAYVVIDAILSNDGSVEGYFDTWEPEKNPYGLKYYGNERHVDLPSIVGDGYVFPSIGSNRIRRELIELMETNKLNQLVVAANSAAISRKAELGASTFVAAKAVVNSGATVGKGCIINTGAIVEHECEIGDYSHIAPGAVLTGNAEIGEEVFIGAGVTTKPGIRIGNRATVGAGAVVLKDIPDGETWAGCPAKKIK